MLVGWTGPRPDLFRDPRAAVAAVEACAGRIAASPNLAGFVCGGQRGVDQWASDAGLALGAPIHLVLPLGIDLFTADWADADRDALVALMNRAATVEITARGTQLSPGLTYDQRNERIVEQSQRLIVVWTGLRRGGTFYTICAAHARGLPVEEVLLPGAPTSALQGRGV